MQVEEAQQEIEKGLWRKVWGEASFQLLDGNPARCANLLRQLMPLVGKDEWVLGEYVLAGYVAGLRGALGDSWLQWLDQHWERPGASIIPTSPEGRWYGPKFWAVSYGDTYIAVDGRVKCGSSCPSLPEVPEYSPVQFPQDGDNPKV